MAESGGGFIPIEKKLGDIFKEAFEFYLHINESSEPTNSPDFQVYAYRVTHNYCPVLIIVPAAPLQLLVRKHIGNFEDATRLVSLGGIFSDNEAFEEIPTGDIKFLLLPFFLGQLTLKLNSMETEVRKNYVEVAEVYYKDFLKRSSEYGLTERFSTDTTVAAAQVAATGRSPNELEELKQMAVQRNEKLRKFKEKKELEEKINLMKVAVEREDDLDDDVLRGFYMDLIKFSILEAEEELKFLDQEKLMLDFRQRQTQQTQGGGSGMDDSPEATNHQQHPHRHQHGQKVLKPIIITRDALQKAVYGRGYPSMPTMSVEDFYHERVAAGVFPDPDKKSTVKARQDMTDDEIAELDEQEAVVLEEAIERDDEYQRARQAAMDEFKDNVRRGDGNRYNRS